MFKNNLFNNEILSRIADRLLKKISKLNKLITLYQIIITWTNVECERSFSKQKRTKTRLKASMEEEILPSLIQLSINSHQNKNMEFFIHSYIHAWGSQKIRYFFNLQTLVNPGDL